MGIYRIENNKIIPFLDFVYHFADKAKYFSLISIFHSLAYKRFISQKLGFISKTLSPFLYFSCITSKQNIILLLYLDENNTLDLFDFKGKYFYQHPSIFFLQIENEIGNFSESLIEKGQELIRCLMNARNLGENCKA